MDTKLSGGDLAAGARGLPYFIGGWEEYLQRAELCLAIRKGSFRYDRELGSRLYLLKEGEDERALALCGQALERCEGLRAVSAAVGEEWIDCVLDTPAGRGTVRIKREKEGETHGEQPQL